MLPGPNHLLQLGDRVLHRGDGGWHQSTSISCHVGLLILGRHHSRLFLPQRVALLYLVLHHLIMSAASVAACLMT